MVWQLGCDHSRYSFGPISYPSVNRLGKARGIDAINPVRKADFGSQVFANVLRYNFLYLINIRECLLRNPRSEINMVQNDPVISMRTSDLRNVQELVQSDDMVPPLGLALSHITQC